MAKDVVTRLRLESGEFDNRIKRATAGLMQLEQECRNSGKSLATLTNDQKQYVQSLGQMQTVSNTVRGKLGELTQAYTELSVQYKRLADDEKKGDYGKALSASLDQLKARIGETKAQLNDVSVELGNTKNASNETGSVLDNLAGKFGLNIKQLTGIGAALATAKAALEVAKDAFGANEAAVDEWGRIVDSSRSLYEGFLNSINTGDISGFLSRIDQIVQAARTAYDELDRLGTMKTIQAPQISAQQTENDRLRMMIQTRRYIAPVDGRRSAMQNGQPGSIFGYGYVTNEDMPSAGAGAIPVVFANFQQAYTIFDRVGIRSLRDPYTNKPFVGFYTTKRVGSMIANTQAVKFLKCAA